MIDQIGKLLLTLVALTIVSCTAPYRSLSPEALASRRLKPGEGLIIGKFVNKRSGGGPERGAAGEITVASVGQSPQVHVALNQRTRSVLSDPMANMISFPNDDGTFAIPVPAGRYEITNWRIQGTTIDIYSRLPLHAGFAVEPGKASYVGRVNVVTSFGRTLIGLKVLGEGVVLVTDSSSEDIPAIVRSYPTIKRSQCVVSSAPKSYLQEIQRVLNTPRSTFEVLFPNLAH